MNVLVRQLALKRQIEKLRKAVAAVEISATLKFHIHIHVAYRRLLGYFLFMLCLRREKEAEGTEALMRISLYLTGRSTHHHVFQPSGIFVSFLKIIFRKITHT